MHERGERTETKGRSLAPVFQKAIHGQKRSTSEWTAKRNANKRTTKTENAECYARLRGTKSNEVNQQAANVRLTRCLFYIFSFYFLGLLHISLYTSLSYDVFNQSARLFSQWRNGIRPPTERPRDKCNVGCVSRIEKFCKHLCVALVCMCVCVGQAIVAGLRFVYGSAPVYCNWSARENGGGGETKRRDKCLRIRSGIYFCRL